MFVVDIVLLFVAFAGGLSVGLVGIGLTLIILPALIIIFPHVFPHAVALKMAVATTLAAATVAVTVSSITHIRQRNINFKVLAILAPIYVAFAIIGPQLVHALPIKLFQTIVGCLLIAIAVFLQLSKKLPARFKTQQISKVRLITVGVIAALVNSISGIASGSVLIPYLIRYLEPYQAVATSVAAALIVCGLGAITYAISGWGHVNVAYTLGYLYMPAFVLVSIGAIIGVPIGIKLSYKIQLKWLSILLSIFIGISGLVTLLDLWWR